MENEGTVKQNNIIESFVGDIFKEQGEFSIGNPWRNSDLSVTCVVPIIRACDKNPDYIVLSKAMNVDIMDTGRIDKVKIKNNEDKPVFIRMGELLTGKTQERSVVSSRVIMPGEEQNIEVKCVHASRPISPGASFKSGGIAPMRDSLYSSTSARGMSVNQQTSWNMDSNYGNQVNCMLSRDSSPVGETPLFGNINLGEPGSVKQDDLSSAYGKVKDALKDVLKDIPLFNDQIGIVLIDKDGMHSMDCFDLHGSWKAMKESVTGKDAIAIAQEEAEGVFDYKPEKAKEVIKKVLEGVINKNDVFKGENTKTVGLELDGHVGEAVLYKNKVIHLLLARK
jgi:hypothetical protein